jgi:hypothetical protein
MAEHDQDGRMEGLDYWRLCDELSVHQAAALIAGCIPWTESDSRDDPYPDGYEAAKIAISNALQRGAISGRFVPLYGYDFGSGNREQIEHSIDTSNSRIDVDALRIWLAGRGLKTGFFFPKRSSLRTILIPNILDMPQSLRLRFWRGWRPRMKPLPVASHRNRRWSNGFESMRQNSA